MLELYPEQKYACVLEGSSSPSPLSRYSFFCTDPFLVFHSKRARSFAGPPDAIEPLEGDPLANLAALLQKYRPSTTSWVPGLPPFLGGAVGYLGYELLYLIETIPDLGVDDLALPDAYFIFCDTVIATDHLAQKSWIIANGFADSLAEATASATRRLAEARERMSGLGARPPAHVSRDDLRTRGRALMKERPRLGLEHLTTAGIRPVMTKDAYLDVVCRAKEHILAGDIFEVCTAQRFDTEVASSGMDLYRALRAINEAPFASYLRFPEAEVLSSSPERFLRLDRDRWAETRPIKGTRPRGETREKDEAMLRDLVSSEKDNAENIIIVDLARNDLGRVCEFGTVRVPELRIAETYPFAHQLVSTVRGRLRSELGMIDLLRATFPGGSMTGAPKVEAMKVIDRLEPVKRGIFAGSIGYFDFEGLFDLNIVIRTLIKKGDLLSFHVGGALVMDSVPEDEYQETLDKAHALVLAIELTKQGLSR